MCIMLRLRFGGRLLLLHNLANPKQQINVWRGKARLPLKMEITCKNMKN